MKKMILGFAMAVMMLGCVGCGKEEAKNAKEIAEIASENEGFVPEQVVEEPVITEEVAQDIEEVIDENNLEKYYDVTKYVGTPYLTVCEVSGGEKPGTINLIGSAEIYGADIEEYHKTSVIFTIEKTDSLEYWKKYNVIACDNNTTNDTSDDVIAYVFTTPVEE